MPISEAAKKGMIARAQQSAPNECVGLIPSHDGEVFDCPIILRNSSKTPAETFFVDEDCIAEAMRLNGFLDNSPAVIAVWHSHPKSRPTPSREDIEQMQALNGTPMIIVGLVPVPQIHLYAVQGRRIVLKEKW